jgi:hypothetical protein
MSDTITIPVALNPRTVWKLGELAESRNVRIADYLQEIAVAVSHTTHDGLPDPIAARWALGLPDRTIAAELSMTNLAVPTRRRSLGLPANHLPRNQPVSPNPKGTTK